MYTPGRLEAAEYGFSKDCKQLLNLWLSWWGRGPAFAKINRPIFYLIGFHSCYPRWESRLLQLCTIYRIKVRNPNACTASFGWPWVWFSPSLLGPHCSVICTNCWNEMCTPNLNLLYLCVNILKPIQRAISMHKTLNWRYTTEYETFADIPIWFSYPIKGPQLFNRCDCATYLRSCGFR